MKFPHKFISYFNLISIILLYAASGENAMSRNGTPAIILIYLITTLPLLVDKRGVQRLVDASSVLTSPEINFYSAFKDRLNATMNFAQSEYDDKISDVVKQIYDLAAVMLTEELKQQQARESSSTNYADKIVDEANHPYSHDNPPPAVAASGAAETAIDVAKKNPELINAANAEQPDHRKSRRVRKSKYRASRPSFGSRKSQPIRSGPHEWENKGLRPIGLRAKLPATSSMVSHKVDDSPWRMESKNVANAARSREMNGLAAGIESGMNQRRLPSVKWQKKSKIDGKGRNLQKISPLRGLGHLHEHPDDLIESHKDLDDEKLRRNSHFGGNERGSRLSARSVDSFPEVFSVPAVGTPNLPSFDTGNGLDEAIRKANFLLNSASANSGRALTVPSPDENIRRISKQLGPLNGPMAPNENNGSNLTSIMENVLVELRSLKECKEEGKTLPEGSPCDVVGTWNSETIGLQFHISMAEPGTAQSRAFVEGKKLEIEITERVTPRQHELMDCDWFVTGRTLKHYGGPLVISAQKAEKNIMATFAGLCKNCGSIPTIFGAWTFVYPAKDCQDVSLAIETRRDVFRKDTLQAKRKQRLDRFGAKSTEKCGSC